MKSVLKLGINTVINHVEKDGFFIFPRFFPLDEVVAAREEYFEILSTEPLRSGSTQFAPQELVNRCWRKQTIGSSSGSGEPYSQLLQTTYFHPQTPGLTVLGGIARKLTLVRNALTDLRDDFGFDLTGDPFWNACRVHHYPVGGGHMAAHRDTLFPQLLSESRLPFLQVFCTLSRRSVDFNVGGGWLVSRTGSKVFLESDDNEGTLIVFDGSITHGVDDVDPGEFFDFSSSKGRLACFVNLYQRR